MSKSTENESNTSPKGSRGWSIMSFFLGLSILLCSGFWAFSHFVAQPVVSPVQRVADAIASFTEQKVTINGSTAVLEKSEIGELAVVQRKMQSIVKYQTDWLGSEKTLIVKGDFVVKAGFELNEGWAWQVDGIQIVGDWPEARVLSVEPVGDMEIYYSESGVINKLNSTDHAKAFNELKNVARLEAEESDISDEAERYMRTRMQDLIGSRYVLP